MKNTHEPEVIAWLLPKQTYHWLEMFVTFGSIKHKKYERHRTVRAA
jgi:hypothetical protein